MLIASNLVVRKPRLEFLLRPMSEGQVHARQSILLVMIGLTLVRTQGVTVTSESGKTGRQASCMKRGRPEEGETRVRRTDSVRVLRSLLELQLVVWRQRLATGAGAILRRSVIIRSECPQIILTWIFLRRILHLLALHLFSTRHLRIEEKAKSRKG